MGSQNDVEGRIYSFRSQAECAELGISTHNIPEIVLFHMVLVLDRVPNRKGYVEVMTVSICRLDLTGSFD
jgi:hypothetical protein